MSHIAGMAQMNLSVPEGLKAWAEARVSEGRYSSTSDYVRDLMRRDQEAEQMRQRLQKAVDLGRAAPTTPYDEKMIEDIIAASRDAA